MVMLVAASSDRFRAVFSLGPAAVGWQYGGKYIYCDPKDEKEVELRSPMEWLHCVKIPTYVLEGSESENWEGAAVVMSNNNYNPQIRFIQVPGHDHFSVISPITELIAAQIINKKIDLTPETVQGLK